MDYVLQTHGLTKGYGGFLALDGLSMRVPKGSIYGFVGRNGAGKTTLIRLICGLQRPTGGEFSLFGVPHHSREILRSRRRMGAMVETPGLYPELTAEDNLKLQYLLLGLPCSGLPELLSLVGLEDAGKKRVRNFSLGMKQRLGIALALAGDPEFLVLDEPINGLDPQAMAETRETLRTLNRERGITILISSHILDELSRLATHYGILDRGRMVKELSGQELSAACRKRTQMEVSDTAILARVLDRRGLDYRLLSGTRAEVFGEVTVTPLVLALARENCQVLTMTQQEESLAQYYLSLTGGDRT